MVNFFAGVVFLCVFLLWASMAIFLIRVLILGLKSKTWPSVNGKITHSMMLKAKRSETGSPLTIYHAVIQYKYTINGVSFKSQALSFPDQAWQTFNRANRSKRAASQIITNYPLDQNGKVFYNPQNPKQSVLQPGIYDWKFVLILIISFVMGVFFAAILTFMLTG